MEKFRAISTSSSLTTPDYPTPADYTINTTINTIITGAGLSTESKLNPK